MWPQDPLGVMLLKCMFCTVSWFPGSWMKLQLSTVLIFFTTHPLSATFPSLCRISSTGVSWITSHRYPCPSGSFWGPQTKTRIFYCPSRPCRLQTLLSLSWASFQPLGSISVPQIHSPRSFLRAFAHAVSPHWAAFYPLLPSKHLINVYSFLWF